MNKLISLFILVPILQVSAQWRPNPYTTNTTDVVDSRVNSFISSQITSTNQLVYPGIIRGLEMRWLATNSYAIDSGLCDIQSSNQVFRSTVSVTNSATSLVASAMYNVYAFVNAGVLNFEHATNGPALYFGTAYSRTNDGSRRYIGSFSVDAGGGVKNFTQQGNFIYYQSGNPVLSVGQATVSTAVSCTTNCPLTSRSAYFRFSSNETNRTASIGYGTVSSTSQTIILGPAVQTSVLATARITTWCPLSNQTFSYLWNSGAPTDGLSASLIGYQFDR